MGLKINNSFVLISKAFAPLLDLGLVIDPLQALIQELGKAPGIFSCQLEAILLGVCAEVYRKQVDILIVLPAGKTEMLAGVKLPGAHGPGAFGVLYKLALFEGIFLIVWHSSGFILNHDQRLTIPGHAVR